MNLKYVYQTDNTNVQLVFQAIRFLILKKRICVKIKKR
jgi:hypothetical protein